MQGVPTRVRGKQGDRPVVASQGVQLKPLCPACAHGKRGVGGTRHELRSRVQGRQSPARAGLLHGREAVVVVVVVGVAVHTSSCGGFGRTLRLCLLLVVMLLLLLLL